MIDRSIWKRSDYTYNSSYRLTVVFVENPLLILWKISVIFSHWILVFSLFTLHIVFIFAEFFLESNNGKLKMSDNSSDDENKKREWNREKPKTTAMTKRPKWSSTKNVSGLPSNGFASLNKAKSLGLEKPVESKKSSAIDKGKRTLQSPPKSTSTPIKAQSISESVTFSSSSKHSKDESSKSSSKGSSILPKILPRIEPIKLGIDKDSGRIWRKPISSGPSTSVSPESTKVHLEEHAAQPEAKSTIEVKRKSKPEKIVMKSSDSGKPSDKSSGTFLKSINNSEDTKKKQKEYVNKSKDTSKTSSASDKYSESRSTKNSPLKKISSSSNMVKSDSSDIQKSNRQTPSTSSPSSSKSVVKRSAPEKPISPEVPASKKTESMKSSKSHSISENSPNIKKFVSKTIDSKTNDLSKKSDKKTKSKDEHSTTKNLPSPKSKDPKPAVSTKKKEKRKISPVRAPSNKDSNLDKESGVNNKKKNTIKEKNEDTKPREVERTREPLFKKRKLDFKIPKLNKDIRNEEDTPSSCSSKVTSERDEEVNRKKKKIKKSATNTKFSTKNPAFQKKTKRIRYRDS